MKAKTTTLAIFCLFAALFFESNAEAKGWRGIVPLHSTRADVEKILGPPTEQLAAYSVFYRTANETVIIDYARGLACGIGEKYSQWRVPRNTVESIFITPYIGSPLSQLSIDESKYKKFSGGHTPDLYYINESEGERLTVFEDVVKSISYFPAAADAHLECSGLPRRRDTNCEGLPPSPFDSYGNLPLVEEKQRLDSFLTTLKEVKNRKGYIITYAGKPARAGEAKERAEREKNYLVKVRRFPAGRLYTIDGGYREKPKVELYVVDGSNCPPTSDPTVDPRDVRIINTRPRKNRRLS
jgi:hypothetical protein